MRANPPMMCTPSVRPSAITSPVRPSSPNTIPSGYRGRLAHGDEGEHRVRRMTSAVALAAARPGQGLLHRVDGQHPERARDARAQLDVLDAARGLLADPVVVVGLPADDRAQAGDAVVAPGLHRVL